jgi:ABC-type transport system substrate-binding protein
LARDLFVGNSFGPQSKSVVQFAWGLFTAHGEDQAAHPGLAEGYQVSGDGRTHTMTMRDGLRFHDGSPLTAVEAVAALKPYFFENDPLRGPGTYGMVPLFWGGFPGAVTGISAPDAKTVVFQLNQPRADIRGGLINLAILNPKVLADKNYGTDAGALKNAGSGPFRVENFAAGQFVEYSRFDGFVEEAYLDRLRLQLVADPSARYLALKGAQVNAADALAKADWDASVGDPAYRAHVSGPYVNAFVGLNATKNTVLASNEKVRRALAMAMNRPAYVASFWGKDIAEVASQVALVPGVNGYNDTVKPIPYDPEGAKALLAESGVAPGDLSFSIIDPPAFGGAPELGAMLEAMAGDLAKVGVTLTVNITDVAGWLSGAGAHDLSVGPYGNNGGGLEAAVAALYFNRAPQRPQIPDAATYKALSVKALQATSADAQGAALRELMAASAEHVAGIPVAYSKAAALTDARVHDLDAKVTGSLNRTWIEA